MVSVRDCCSSHNHPEKKQEDTGMPSDGTRHLSHLVCCKSSVGQLMALAVDKIVSLCKAALLHNNIVSKYEGKAFHKKVVRTVNATWPYGKLDGTGFSQNARQSNHFHSQQNVVKGSGLIFTLGSIKKVKEFGQFILARGLDRPHLPKNISEEKAWDIVLEFFGNYIANEAELDDIDMINLRNGNMETLYQKVDSIKEPGKRFDSEQAKHVHKSTIAHFRALMVELKDCIRKGFALPIELDGQLDLVLWVRVIFVECFTLIQF
jgi:hypothetical protein